MHQICQRMNADELTDWENVSVITIKCKKCGLRLLTLQSRGHHNLQVVTTVFSVSPVCLILPATDGFVWLHHKATVIPRCVCMCVCVCVCVSVSVWVCVRTDVKTIAKESWCGRPCDGIHTDICLVSRQHSVTRARPATQRHKDPYLRFMTEMMTWSATGWSPNTRMWWQRTWSQSNCNTFLQSDVRVKLCSRSSCCQSSCLGECVCEASQVLPQCAN